jgi:hypothetical protein
MPDAATSKPLIFSKSTLGAVIFIAGLILPDWVPALRAISDNIDKILEIVGAAIMLWGRISATLPIKGIFKSPTPPPAS